MDVVNVVEGTEKLSKTGKKWKFHSPNEKDHLYLKQKYGLSDFEAALALHRISAIEESGDVISPLLKTHLPDLSVLPDSEKAFDFTYEMLLSKKAFPFGTA